MFRQIVVNPLDRDLQRIWWQEADGEINSYRLTTVTYGLNCAPFLALRTLKQLITDEGQRYPLAIKPMSIGRYVDDIFGGAETLDDAKKILDQLIQLCNAGGFPLQKWRSNFPKILPDSTQKISAIVEQESTHQKILGLIWNCETDEFGFSVKPTTTDIYTKRKIASDIAKLYDPLGFTAPVLIKAKLILQELWCLQTDWDDPIPSNLQEHWSLFRKQLLKLNTLTIPRWIESIRGNVILELHGFSDASMKAMAAVVYSRILTTDGQIYTRMISAKTKVASIKRLSISRLELTVALLLTRLVKTLIKALKVTISSIHCWSDSELTFCWINSPPSRWKDYVQNRVSSIQEILPECKWNFVPGKKNPADCATRGVQAESLSSHELWWKGPEWLARDKTFWPKPKKRTIDKNLLEERPKTVLIASAEPPSYWYPFFLFSSFNKLVRVIATCRRFFQKLKKKLNINFVNQPITPSELFETRKILIGIIQRIHFSQEIRHLSKTSTLPNSNPLLKLTPYLDADGLLRVGGRLNNAMLDEEIKHPLILPKRSPLTTLIIQDAHLKTLHGGTQLTFSHVRMNYWIVNGRVTVCSHILKCVRCIRYRGIRAKQLMGQLPSSRVTMTRP